MPVLTLPLLLLLLAALLLPLLYGGVLMRRPGRLLVAALRPIVLVAVVVALAMVVRVARAATVGDAMVAVVNSSAWGWVVVPLVIALLLLLAWTLREASGWFKQDAHTTRVGQLFDTLADQVDGIAGLLLAHPPTPDDVLAAVRAAATAQAVAYARANMADTIAAVGATDGVMATRVSNAVTAILNDKVMTAPAGSDLQAAALAALGAARAAIAPQPAAMPAA